MAAVAELRTAHTADLDPATIKAARGLLDETFHGEATEADWEHALGGVHALVCDGPVLIGHASVIQRRLLHQGRALRAGYVEAVAVHPDRQGEGHGAALMGALERVLHGAYDLGALGSTDEGAGFYTARGWKLWQGPSSALTPTGIRPTPEADGCLYVFELAVPLDLAGELTCDWRDGDVW
jgi:aminoglycoside 2'-N-acetyltransferase I